jgi:hypothetical protein
MWEDVAARERLTARPGVTLSDTEGHGERAHSRRYLKSVFGCLPCSFTDLLSCVVDALS